MTGGEEPQTWDSGTGEGPKSTLKVGITRYQNLSKKNPQEEKPAAPREEGALQGASGRAQGVTFLTCSQPRSRRPTADAGETCLGPSQVPGAGEGRFRGWTRTEPSGSEGTGLGGEVQIHSEAPQATSWTCGARGPPVQASASSAGSAREGSPRAGGAQWTPRSAWKKAPLRVPVSLWDARECLPRPALPPGLTAVPRKPLLSRGRLPTLAFSDCESQDTDVRAPTQPSAKEVGLGVGAPGAQSLERPTLDLAQVMIAGSWSRVPRRELLASSLPLPPPARSLSPKNRKKRK